jgi:hypothetical protein
MSILVHVHLLVSAPVRAHGSMARARGWLNCAALRNTPPHTHCAVLASSSPATMPRESTAPFLSKLFSCVARASHPVAVSPWFHSIMEDSVNTGAIRWTTKGLSFEIVNADELSRNVLPKYFRHNNVASFIRQLNMYCFRKVSVPRGSAIKQGEAHHLEFCHDSFIRGRADLLPNIQRKARQSDQLASASPEDDDVDEDAAAKSATSRAPRSEPLPQMSNLFLIAPSSTYDTPVRAASAVRKADPDSAFSSATTRSMASFETSLHPAVTLLGEYEQNSSSANDVWSSRQGFRQSKNESDASNEDTDTDADADADPDVIMDTREGRQQRRKRSPVAQPHHAAAAAAAGTIQRLRHTHALEVPVSAHAKVRAVADPQEKTNERLHNLEERLLQLSMENSRIRADVTSLSQRCEFLERENVDMRLYVATVSHALQIAGVPQLQLPPVAALPPPTPLSNLRFDPDLPFMNGVLDGLGDDADMFRRRSSSVFAMPAAAAAAALPGSLGVGRAEILSVVEQPLMMPSTPRVPCAVEATPTTELGDSAKHAGLSLA